MLSFQISLQRDDEMEMGPTKRENKIEEKEVNLKIGYDSLVPII